MIFTLLQDKVRFSRSPTNGKRPQHPGDSAVDLTLEILEKITAGVQVQSLNIRLWNGTYWPDQTPKPATIVLNRPSALREMLADCSEIGVAEAYIASNKSLKIFIFQLNNSWLNRLDSNIGFKQVWGLRGLGKKLCSQGTQGSLQQSMLLVI